jgi:hypothetical protein
MASTAGVPPLTRGNSTISSSDSAPETDEASGIMGQGFLLRDINGVLTRPNRYRPDATLLCPFQILDCEIAFHDVVCFKEHVFSHFRGAKLPTSASCFLCDKKFVQTDSDDGAKAWNEMLSHMAHEHYRQGEQLTVVRPDFALMRWMYSRRLISEHQLKRAQLKPIPVFIPGGGIVNAPSAPTPPSRSPSRLSQAAMLAQLRHPIGSRTDSYTMSAGSRADRRQRDATRQMIRS